MHNVHDANGMNPISDLLHIGSWFDFRHIHYERNLLSQHVVHAEAKTTSKVCSLASVSATDATMSTLKVERDQYWWAGIVIIFHRARKQSWSIHVDIVHLNCILHFILSFSFSNCYNLRESWPGNTVVLKMKPNEPLVSMRAIGSIRLPSQGLLQCIWLFTIVIFI